MISWIARFQSLWCAWLLLSCSVLPGPAATLVKFLTLSDGSWPASMGKVIAAFEEANPDIKVQMDNYPFRQPFETIEVRMKTHDTDIDLISVDVPLVASYSFRGFLAPLDEYVTKDEIEKTWIQASWQAGMYKGHFTAAPQNTFPVALNRKLFQQYGVTPPKALEPGQTVYYDQIADIAKNDRWKKII